MVFGASTFAFEGFGGQVGFRASIFEFSGESDSGFSSKNAKLKVKMNTRARFSISAFSAVAYKNLAQADYWPSKSKGFSANPAAHELAMSPWSNVASFIP